ncbi:tyrosine-type recombinase/integrase [Candidatus Desulforudis audaxviator]|uniref:Phage integrase family protein n=1 Tax=Desulforudis audaxviator (strain MP104C) TaxID=477974 RepID=B1I2C1_DESAP|nr:tyrosine-type recombinase/integrase [Candidatus Desulforudis audaxviator]ACA59044.1 phage integrase family protein [Candidatus Desulforudis audaxviator MP104C]AZK59091.1 Site-specific tyrosine recombinase [Candidatus Desulforudis audaxviator]
MTFEEAIEAYFEVGVVLRGMAAGTVEAYRCDFRDFSRFLESQGVGEVREITTAVVNTYLVGLRKRGLSLSTVHRRKNALSSLLGFCVQQGWVDNNPLRKVILQTKPRTVRNVVLSDMAVRTFLQSDVTYRSVDGLTVTAIKMLLVFTGLRCSEIVSADWAHVNLNSGLLTVFNSKNTARKGLPEGKDRDIPLCQTVIQALNALPYRQGPLLQTRGGLRLGVDALREIVARLSQASRLEYDHRPLTPHCFRHNLASQLVSRGYSEADVATLLGHKPGTVTQAYIHSTIERLREAVQGYDDAITAKGGTEDRAVLTSPGTGHPPSTFVRHMNVYDDAMRYWSVVAGGPVDDLFLLGFILGRRSAASTGRLCFQEVCTNPAEDPHMMRMLQVK